MKRHSFFQVLFLLLAGVISLIACPAYAEEKSAVQSDPSAASADVVVFAHFTDDTQETADAYFNEQYAAYKAYFTGTSGRAFANYMKTVSYDQFSVNVCFPQEEADGTITSIPLNISQAEAKQGNLDASVMASVLAAMPSLSGYTVDCDGDGYIDNLTVIVKAENVSASSEVQSGSTLVPHSNTAGTAGTCGGYQVCNYNILNTERLNTSGSGLIIHEYLHTLGYPDLYRTDGSGDAPVYVWDIMGAVSSRPSLPLAFLRSKISGWLTIDTLTESGTYTLNAQSSSSGDRAFILKSPLRSTEYFVVEYRQRPTALYDSNTLDRDLQGSGIIVYRVDETAENFTNKESGKTGIYVFRPQEGQTGYVSGSDSATALYAFLSSESGRTSIGLADMSAGLSDGALTFSDGENSGIVISDVGSASGDTITFQVTFPDLKDEDLWQDTAFPDESTQYIYNKDAAVTVFNGKLYAAEYDGSSFKLYSYDSGWTSVSADLAEVDFAGQMKLLVYDGSLYLVYSSWSDGIRVMKFISSSGTWSQAGAIENAGAQFDAASVNGRLYVSFLTGDCGECAELAVWNGSGFDLLGTYHTSTFANGAQKIVSCDGKTCVFVRDGSGSLLYGYIYDGSSFAEILNSTDAVKANGFDAVSSDGRIYVSYADAGTNMLKLLTFDGEIRQTFSSEISASDTVLTVVGDTVYMIASPGSGDANFRQVSFSNNAFTDESMVIDAASGSFSIANTGDYLYLSYVRSNDSRIFVRYKNTGEARSVTYPDGWNRISGTWYYYVGGQKSTGWRQVNGKWYYFTSDGAMVTGWRQINGRWYYMTSGGDMVTGWRQINDRWYYFTSGGDMVTGWRQINDRWYYFTSGGDMVTGWRQVNNKWYYFTAGGDMVTGWRQVSGRWYYFTAGGDMVTGWRLVTGKWYWFYTNGAMAENTTVYINGKYYHFGADGSCTNPY